MDSNTEEEEVEKDNYLTIIPTSVIDIEAQKKRVNEDHNNQSSRASYSPFPKEISTLCCEFFLKNCKTVFDPFAGWGDRANAAKQYNLNYIGYDISQKAIDVAYETYGVKNTLANSLTDEIPAFDGFLTCPPYWNLEKYESEQGLDRFKTWKDFLINYLNILTRCYNKAEKGTTFCIMVGEWRSKGVYYDLEYETRRFFKALGAVMFDQIIVSRKKVSKIKIMLPQCKRLGYSVRVHEVLLVFKKP